MSIGIDFTKGNLMWLWTNYETTIGANCRFL